MKRTLIVEGDVTHFNDPVTGLGECFYTIFSREDGHAWERQAAVKINAHEHFFWHHPDAERAFEGAVDMHANPIAPWIWNVSRDALSSALDGTIQQEGVNEWLQAER